MCTSPTQQTPKPTYTVTYNGNGNTGGTAPLDANQYLAGTTVTVQNAGSLVKTGYSFTGWNTVADGSGISYAAGMTVTMGTANITLYAHWTPISTFAVTYNGNGNSGGNPPQDNNRYLTGATVTVLGNTGNLMRTGYTFVSWNTVADGSGISYAAGMTVTMGTANIILYAHWTPISTFAVTYNGNGNSGGNPPQDNNRYLTGATVTVLGNTGNLVRTGYTFVGWNTVADGSGISYAAGMTVTMGTANITLYAHWTPIPAYSVTYNGNGNTAGNAPPDANKYLTGATITVLSDTGNLLRTGYGFIGWNTAADGSGSSYATGAAFAMGSANVTLYAQWMALPPSLYAKFTSSDIAGWTPDDSTLLVFSDRDTTILRSKIDGGADAYYIKGIVQGIAQDVHGPMVDSFSNKELSYYAIVYNSSTFARQMYKIEKDFRAGNSVPLQIQPFDTSVATGYSQLGGIRAFGHFNLFYIELSLMNFPDSADCLNAARQMLQKIQQKVNN